MTANATGEGHFFSRASGSHSRARKILGEKNKTSVDRLSQNQYGQEWNRTAKQQFPFLIPGEKKFPCWGGSWAPVLKRGLSTQFF